MRRPTDGEKTLVNWSVSPYGVTCRRGGADGLHITASIRRILAVLAVLLVLPLAALPDTKEGPDDGITGASAGILLKYLQATQTHDETLRGASMEVDIAASVPNLKEQGRLHALRKISRVGQITYHVLGFQGDNTIKNQVIGRYLQAEQQGQGDKGLAITSANYKFKYKGEKETGGGKNVYVFQLSPLKKRVGLFKGEMWLDVQTYLPVFEKGHFVKNPNIFLKKVDFIRAFRIQNGVAVPEYTISTMDAHLIGKVELNISYSKFSPNSDVEDAAGESDSTAITTATSK